MENREAVIVEIEREDRVDKTISESLGISRSYAETLIKEGLVSVNGKSVKKKQQVVPGDEVIVRLKEPEEIDVLPEEMPIEIIYEDEDVLVVNKERGRVVHPAPGNYTGTLVNGLLFYNKELSCINGKYRPGIVHRIDKDTSGLLMIAKNDEAHHSLSEDLKEHNIIRKYTALVSGTIEEASGEIDLPIGRDPKSRIKMAVVPEGKVAKTYYKVVDHYKGYTLAECTLETGRTHQIRVHMAYIKHPVAGDPLYGNRGEKIPLDGQFLHAGILGFKHPRTGEEMLFESPLPPYFMEKLQDLKEGK